MVNKPSRIKDVHFKLHSFQASLSEATFKCSKISCPRRHGKVLYTRYPIVARALGLAAECVARAKVSCIQGKVLRTDGMTTYVNPWHT